MKYLKCYESDTMGTPKGDYFLAKIEGQPKHGPTVICFKKPDTEETHIVYTGKNIYKEDESPIQYTWRYEESYNGHPAVIVNFSRIDSIYTNNIVCVECNNMAKGSGSNAMPQNKYNLKGENNNRALNVLDSSGYINGNNKDITWYRLGDLELNRDYPIYITVIDRYMKRLRSIIDLKRMDINDYEVRINIRPTIRCNFSPEMNTITTTTFRHTNHIPAKEYMSVKFSYINIFQL